MKINNDHRQPPILEMENATVRREGIHILDQFSLTIQMNENTAIAGPNGSGKSTFIKLITQEIYPIANKEGAPPVRMFGKDHWVLEELKSKLSIVSSDLQNSFLHNTKEGHIPGLDVVVTGFFSSLRLFPHQHISEYMIEKAKKALSLMDATQLADKMLNKMSTGEVRRVLISRALVTEPEVLILDEPTTALDFVARHKFMDQIRKIVQGGTTLILVTHHIEEMIPEIERVVLIKNGKKEFDGSKNDILTSANLSEIYDHRVKLDRNNGLYKVHVD
ncbi:ABC transporter ATP-binding protein [Rhodohalobacter sp. 614A]|uniref:ABC transporter ATP-binding protein n=1 Tax=Rhodohalobacter sp. 614A TaxID=2908649 RepID=UPI001F385249|nr:ATP-binding cassette domain-containing protein [Rhodohalobacter sp. 614A]